MIRRTAPPGGLCWALAACVLAALPAAGREVLTPEEQAEREIEAKKKAPPVLAVEPASLSAVVKPGEPVMITLTVRNAGGKTLVWSVLSAPKWARLDTMSGELGFGAERKLVIIIEPEKLPDGGPEGGVEGAITIVSPDAEGSPAAVAIAVEMPARPAQERRAPLPPAAEMPKPRRILVRAGLAVKAGVSNAGQPVRSAEKNDLLVWPVYYAEVTGKRNAFLVTIDVEHKPTESVMPGLGGWVWFGGGGNTFRYRRYSAGAGSLRWFWQLGALDYYYYDSVTPGAASRQSYLFLAAGTGVSWAGRIGFANLSVDMHLGKRIGMVEELTFMEPTLNALFAFTFGATF